MATSTKDAPTVIVQQKNGTITWKWISGISVTLVLAMATAAFGIIWQNRERVIAVEVKIGHAVELLRELTVELKEIRKEIMKRP